MQQQWKNLKEKHQWQNEFHICSLKRRGSYQIDFKHFEELVQSEAFRDVAIFADELLVYNNDDVQSLTDIATVYEQRTIWLAITFIRNAECPSQASL